MKRSLVYAMAAVAAAVLMALPAAYAANPPAKGEKPQGPPPKPLVLRFHYIPAGSFVDTLARLGRGNRLGDALEKIPLAVNEPANAVVIVAPPEVADYLATIAKGLDQPNEFRAMREAEEHKAAESRLKLEEARRKLPPPPAAPSAGPMGQMRGMMQGMGRGMMGGRPGMMGPEMGRMRERMGGREGVRVGPPQGLRGMRPMMERGQREWMGGREGMRERMEGREGERAERGPRGERGQRGEQGERAGPPERRGAMMGRMGGGMGGSGVGQVPRMRGLSSLISPEGRKAVGLSDEQAGKIKSIITETTGSMQREMERVRQAVEKAPEAERPAKMREMMEKIASEHVKRMETMHDAVLKILSAEQRVKAEKWIREQAPMGPPPATEPKKPEAAPRKAPAFFGTPAAKPSAGESLEPAPTRFWLVADEADAPPAEAPKADAPKPANPERRERAQAARAMQLFRLLGDPEVRTQLGLTPDQDKTIVSLEEKARQLLDQVRDQVLGKFKDAESKAATKEEKQTIRQQMRQAIQEAVAAARPQVDAIIKEASGVLTEQQRTKLQDLARQRIQAEWATGGFAALLAKKTQDELGLSAEAAAKVKAVLDELRAETKKLHDETVGPGQPPAPGGPRGENFETMRAKYHDLVQKARAKIMELLTPEQREKLEKLLHERGGPGPGGPGEPRPRRGPPPAEPGAKGYGPAT